MTTTTVSKTDFMKSLKGGFIDVNNLSDPVRAALTAASVDPKELAKLADKKGLVSAEKVFRFIDGYDTNKKPSSFIAGSTDASGAYVPTKAGQIYGALKDEIAANRAVANGNVKNLNSWSSNHGVIDVNNLSTKVKDQLGASKSGVTEADLRAVAGTDGQIKGKDEFAELHKLLDKADGASDGVATTKSKNIKDGTVSDGKTAALYGALNDEVTANRALPQYTQPGAKAAPAQDRMTVDKNAFAEPDASKRLPEVDLKMKGVDQFDLYPGDADKGGKACFEAAVKQCSDYNSKTHGKKAPKLNGPNEAIQVAYAEDKKGRVAVDPTQAKIGREYIDKALDAGYPAVVGVSYTDDSYNNDKMTDHFVTIHKRGYDDKGRLYYEFKDPGDNARTGRLYVDQTTGKMFKEGDLKGGYVGNLDYNVTQVRTYEGL